jgi:hypothetical protein
MLEEVCGPLSTQQWEAYLRYAEDEAAVRAACMPLCHTHVLHMPHSTLLSRRAPPSSIPDLAAFRTTYCTRAYPHDATLCTGQWGASVLSFNLFQLFPLHGGVTCVALGLCSPRRAPRAQPRLASTQPVSERGQGSAPCPLKELSQAV